MPFTDAVYILQTLGITGAMVAAKVHFSPGIKLQNSLATARGPFIGPGRNEKFWLREASTHPSVKKQVWVGHSVNAMVLFPKVQACKGYMGTLLPDEKSAG